MDLWVVKYASRRSRMRDVPGASAVRGARMRGVLAFQAAALDAGERGQTLDRPPGVTSRHRWSLRGSGLLSCSTTSPARLSVSPSLAMAGRVR
jgi:hypothetical protein